MSSSMVSTHTYVSSHGMFGFPSTLYLILGIDLHIMQDFQIILLINDFLVKSCNILFHLHILLWTNSYGRYFAIALA
jgi:hypothetical protein